MTSPRQVNVAVRLALAAGLLAPALPAQTPAIVRFPAPLANGLHLAAGVLQQEHSGVSVALGGDFDDDGHGDFVVGTPAGFDPFGTLTGLVTVVLGGPNLPAVMSLGPGAGRIVFYGVDLDGHTGWSVDFAGDVNGDGVVDLVVGAPRADRPGIPDAGKVYVLFGGPMAPGNYPIDAPPLGGFVLEGEGANHRTGHSVARAGDVDGDGFADIVAGAPLASSVSAPNGGRAFVVRGSATPAPVLQPPYPVTDVVVMNGIDVFGQAGLAVGGGGDMNGDGFSDVVVGAPLASFAGTLGGKAYVIKGGGPGAFPGGGLSTAYSVMYGPLADALLGHAVADAGDVNGDGFDDLLVGGHFYGTATTGDIGVAYLVLGGPQTAGLVFLQAVPAGVTRFDGPNDSVSLGRSVARAGDLNDDGFGDFLVGAPQWNVAPTGSTEGRAYLFFGAPTFPAVLPVASPGRSAVVLEGSIMGDTLGFSVAGGASVDGPGCDDAIVGVPYADPGGVFNAGAVILIPGGSLPKVVGLGCGRNGEPAPEIWFTGALPQLGSQAFAVTLTASPPGGLGALLWVGNPIPAGGSIPLDPFGLVGCSLYVDALLVRASTTTVDGLAFVPFPIPALPYLVDQTVLMQWTVFEIGVTGPGSVALVGTTQALSVLISP